MSGFRHEIKDCYIRLHIDELYPDDEGYYSCEVENPMGKSLHSQMYLKVNGKSGYFLEIPALHDKCDRWFEIHSPRTRQSHDVESMIV